MRNRYYRHSRRRPRLPLLLMAIGGAWLVAILIGQAVVKTGRNTPSAPSKGVDIPDDGPITHGRPSQVEISDDGPNLPGRLVNITQHERRDGTRVIVEEYEVRLSSGRVATRRRTYVFPPGVPTAGEFAEDMARRGREGMEDKLRTAQEEAEKARRARESGVFPR